MKLEYFLTVHTKINSKWIKGLNVRPETIKLLAENIGRTLDDINQSKILYDPPPAAAAAAKSLQLCPTLCDPIDGSPPGSPIPGILQAKILEDLPPRVMEIQTKRTQLNLKVFSQQRNT